MKRISIVVALLLYSTLIFAGSYQTHRVEMRDGAELATFVFLHQGNSAPAPTMLVRTPYLEGINDQTVSAERLQGYARFGMLFGTHVVVQAMRGTLTSDGIFRWLSSQEIDDAQDTIEWLEQQEFFNDQLMLLGVSYPGFGALAAGITNHPSIKLIIAGSPPTNPLTDSFTAGGIIGFGLLDYIWYNGHEGCKDVGWPTCYKKIESFKNNPNIFNYDNYLFGQDIEEWDYITANFLDLESPFWRERGILSRLKEIKVPTIHIGGMVHDQDGRDALYNYLEIQRTSKYSYNHHLVLGNWGHDPFMGNDIVFPVMGNAFRETILENKEQLTTIPKVVVTSTVGDKGFVAGDEYPIEEIHHDNIFYLGKYNGNNIVFKKMVADEVSSSYVFNPIEDQANNRLQFAQGIESDMKINGMIELDLSISIDTPQTDIYLNVYKYSQTSGWKQLFITSFADRKRVYNTSKTIKVKLQTPPLYEQLQAGDYLIYYIDSGDQRMGYNSFLNHNVDNRDYFSEFNTANVTLHHSFLLSSKVTIPTETPYFSGGMFNKSSKKGLLPASWERELDAHREAIRSQLVY